MNYPHSLLLAILQQAEYDRNTFWRWVRAKRSSEEAAALSQAKPERWTPKLRVIRTVSGFLLPIVGAARAVSIAAYLTELPQKLLSDVILWSAARRLRTLQRRGLTVIAVVGSYGKTTTKHHLRHLLGSLHHTLATPESVNTPLGIAAVIHKLLTHKHSVFIVEFGEQKPGDINKLTDFVRPDIAVVTPIGFAHGEHLGSEKNIQKIFTELTASQHHPKLYLVDDANKNIFSPNAETIWYGTDPDSQYRLTSLETSLNGSTAKLDTPEKQAGIAMPLFGSHHFSSALPGLIILAEDLPLEKIIPFLAYTPPVHRRLEVHHNPNGTVVVDNSYNTNPGAWREMKTLLQSLSREKVVVVTAGFVELDEVTNSVEQRRLADDLLALADGVVILRTRQNQQLRERLSGQKTVPVAEADNFDEALQIIRDQQWPLQILWLEGGNRELYQ